MKSIRSQYIMVIIFLGIVHEAVSMAIPCRKNQTRIKRDMPDFGGMMSQGASAAAEAAQNAGSVKEQFEEKLGEKTEFLRSYQ